MMSRMQFRITRVSSFIIQPTVKERKMTDDSVRGYFEFSRANLNGEKKTSEMFLGFNLQ